MDTLKTVLKVNFKLIQRTKMYRDSSSYVTSTKFNKRVRVDFGQKVVKKSNEDLI